MRVTPIVLVLLSAPCLAADNPIVPKGAKLEKLWGDGEFTEGPAQGPDGCIYFSDIGNRIMKFDPDTGKTTEYRKPSGRANGLDFDPRGRLVACEGANTGGKRRVTVTDKNGKVRVLADRWQGKRFNSPNDLTIDAKGRVYFTDPRYVGDEPRELDHESVYRIDPLTLPSPRGGEGRVRGGKVERIITDVQKPNGIILSPDMKTLYLADNNAKGKRQLLAFPLKGDGTVGKKKVLYDFREGRGIDGMSIDTKGNIYATAGRGDKAGVYVFSPKGERIAFIPTPEAPSNCVFGGPDRNLLYVTAGKSLYRIKLNTKGFAVFWPKKGRGDDGAARKPVEVFTDPDKAGPDFKVQGEYAGEVAGKGKYGAQVVALGGGKFDVYFLTGGLPGDGWDAKSRVKASAATADGKTTLTGDWTGQIADGKLTGKAADGARFTLQRVERKSQSLGAKPPKGAVVLFDGSSADQWQGGKVVEGNLLNCGTRSKKPFGPGKLHIEFRTPFRPTARGQRRGNSGVYVMGSEVQILDSFGLTGAKNECGALYGKAKPAVNMCYPPLSWQTFDIEIRPSAKEGELLATVRHNGVKVHDNFAIRGSASRPVPINLQNHGNPVVYRNIWFVPAGQSKEERKGPASKLPQNSAGVPDGDAIGRN